MQDSHGRYDRNRQFQPYVFRPNFMKNQDGEKKQQGRKVIDWTGACVHTMLSRRFRTPHKDRASFQPLTSTVLKAETPGSLPYLPANSVTTRFVRTATNKQKCPVYQIVWTPDGRRLVTGAASGEFTLWNGMAFNFETILQAHDQPVRAMCWSNDGRWLATGDHQGYIKYWQQNMNNCCMFQGHKDQPCRGISFSPTDAKFASCSDDGTVRIWDFFSRTEEKILRGHGADVKKVDWHPHKGLIASGSKDLQTPIKLWDPKAGKSVTTLHSHKGTVMDIQWNRNGHWLASAARDHLVKVFDIRNLKTHYQVLRGHRKEASALAWHTQHEGLLATGGSEGSIIYWLIGEDQPVGQVDGGHESLIWTMAWHPLGHVLATASNDHSTKFWSRQLTTELGMRDPTKGEEMLAEINKQYRTENGIEFEEEELEIPGLDGFDDGGPVNQFEAGSNEYYNNREQTFRTGLTLHNQPVPQEELPSFEKKKMYTKPVPKEFANAWEKNREGDILPDKGGKSGGYNNGSQRYRQELHPYGHRPPQHPQQQQQPHPQQHSHNPNQQHGRGGGRTFPQQGSNYVQWDGR